MLYFILGILFVISVCSVLWVWASPDEGCECRRCRSRRVKYDGR
jgi:hypothetical protein